MPRDLKRYRQRSHGSVQLFIEDFSSPSIAGDSGTIPIEKTVAVGGTEWGADCAIVVWPFHCHPFFDFRVLEVLANPYQRVLNRE